MSNDINTVSNSFFERSKEFDFNIVIPNFCKVVQLSETKGNIFESYNSSDISDYGVFIKREGHPVEKEGYLLSILFVSKYHHLMDELVFHFSASFTCIASIVDNSGEERFTQSFVKVYERGLKMKPFGFKRFLKCSTLLNDPDEFISNDTLTIYCWASSEEKGFMGLKIKLPNFPVNVNDYCPSDNKCVLPNNINKCCQSIVCEQNPACIKLIFNGLLFKILKEESEYFRRLPDVQLRGGNSRFSVIDQEEYEGFYQIEQAFLTGYLVVRSVASCYELYEMADKYQISCIMDACSSYMVDGFNPYNSTKILMAMDSLSNRTSAFHFNKQSWPYIVSMVNRFDLKLREEPMFKDSQDIESDTDETKTD